MILFPLKAGIDAEVTAVLGAHIFTPFISYVLHFLTDGEIAVYIFWLMSAYVISINLFRKNTRNYIKSVIAKRYFRLVIPVLGSVLFAYSILTFGGMHNQLLGVASGNEWLGRFYMFEPNF